MSAVAVAPVDAAVDAADEWIVPPVWCDWCGDEEVAAAGDRCGACIEETRPRCVRCEAALDDDAHDTDDGDVCSSCYEERGICGHCSGSGEGMRDGTTCGACRGSGEGSSDADDDARERYAEWRAEERRDREACGGWD